MKQNFFLTLTKEAKPNSGFLKSFLWLVMLLFQFSAFAQEQIMETLKASPTSTAFRSTDVAISYGESISLDVLRDAALPEVSWIVKNSNLQTLAQGNGKLAEYVFSEPGKYTIELKLNTPAHKHDESSDHDEHSCGGPSVPNTINVSVANAKVEFLFNEFKLKAPLVGGTVQGNSLTIPVIVKTFDGKEFNYSTTKVTTAGVQTTLIGVLDKQFTTLKPGKTTLQYALSGMVKSGTYIMFDFVDAAGNIQSHALTTPIQ